MLKFITYVLPLLLFCSLNLVAKNQPLILHTSDAPPHMIKNNQQFNGYGIDVDIVDAVFKKLNLPLEIEFSPLKRGMEQVQRLKADMFLPTFFQPDNETIYLSEPYIKYRPMIFTLKKNHHIINKITDLAGKRIISFQGAKGYFGEEFSNTMDIAKYTEFHDMTLFPQMLLSNRYDVVVLDYYIFYFLLKEYQMKFLDKSNKNTDKTQKKLTELIQQHDLIPPVYAHVGFNNKNLRNSFNAELENFMLSDKYQDIIIKYIGDVQ